MTACTRWRDDRREGRHIPRCNERRPTCARCAGCCTRRHAAPPIVRHVLHHRSSPCSPHCATRSARKAATGSGSGHRHHETGRTQPAALDRQRGGRALFDRAVEHYLKYHIDTMSLVGSALAADPDFVMAHCLKGYLLLTAANPANRHADRRDTRRRPGQRATHHAAREAACRRLRRLVATASSTGPSPSGGRSSTPRRPTCSRCASATPRGSATARHRRSSSRPTASRHAGHPTCPATTAAMHLGLRARGDRRLRRRRTRGGCRAGTRPNQLLRASRQGARAWRWTAARARAATGSAAQIPNWSAGNNLIHHLWWHRTLMELDLGERDAVLASYDRNIRNFDDPMTKAVPDHYVDLQNATALLWRLEQLGIDVGDRWQELADKAEARIGEAGHLLLVPHLMLALAATGRDDGRRALPRRAARTRRRPRSVDRAGDRRRGHSGLRGGAGAPPRRSRPRRRSAGAAPGRRSACSAAATRSATCSSRC